VSHEEEAPFWPRLYEYSPIAWALVVGSIVGAVLALLCFAVGSLL
jgi:hypothetical protein